MKTLVTFIILTLGLTVSSFAQKAEKEIKEYTCNVNMDCHSCKAKIEKNIAFEKGVKDMEVILESNTVKIKYRTDKTSSENLKEAIIKLGYKVTNESETVVE